MKCTVINRSSVGDSQHLLWKPAPGPAMSFMRLWRQLRIFSSGIFRGNTSRWAACRMMDMVHHSARWEDFLREFNVRGIFHEQEAGLDYLSIACDAGNSARVGFNWSHYPWPETSMANVWQARFLWGRHYADVLAQSGSCPSHVLLTGCVFRDAYPGNDYDGTAHRSLVTPEGVSRVLTIYDTSLPCEDFYEFFLRRVVQDPRWGLLIKTRLREDNLPWFRHPLSELKSQFDEAAAAGRVAVLGARISPAEGAAAADFSVSVDISSAAVVAALGGHRAIQLDYVRLHESPVSDWAKFYKAGPDRLVFDDPEKLWSSLNRYFDDPGSDRSLGLIDDDLLQEVDPFRDGKGAQRVGEYLRWYLEGLDDGLTRDDALDQATTRYSTSWGDQAVWSRPQGISDVYSNGVGPIKPIESKAQSAYARGQHG